MIILVTGGSASGKSEYAEERLIALAGENPKYYIATMKIEKAAAARIERHRHLRAGKGFITIEEDSCLLNVLTSLPDDRGEASCIIEDIPNLLANLMFSDAGTADENAIISDIRQLGSICQNLVIVTGDIFCDGVDYDEVTSSYIAALGRLNILAAKMADEVIRVVAGIPCHI